MSLKYSFLMILATSLFILACNSPNIKEKKTTDIKIAKNQDNNNQKKDSLFTNQFELAKENINSNKTKYYYLDNSKSLIVWMCVTHTGYVKFKKGKIGVIDNKIVSGDFEILMDSIRDTDIDYDLMRIVLENTLKSDSFFSVKQHPVSKLELTHSENIGVNEYRFGGNLIINNKSNRISFSANIIPSDSSILVITNKFYFDRTKYGITIYSRNFDQTDDSFLFTDSVGFKVTAVFNNSAPK